MVRFLENIQKELLSAAHYATMDNKRIVPPAFSPTFAPPHPYFSQLLFNNSYMNRYPPPPPPPPPLMRFGNTPSDRPFSFHLPTQKRRRTKVILLLFFSLSDTFLFSEKKKVTDTRLSPRIATKIIPHEDMADDEKSVSNHSYDSNSSNHHHHHHHHSQPPPQQQSTIEYNAFQISILQMTFRCFFVE